MFGLDRDGRPMPSRSMREITTPWSPSPNSTYPQIGNASMARPDDPYAKMYDTREYYHRDPDRYYAPLPEGKPIWSDPPQRYTQSYEPAYDHQTIQRDLSSSERRFSPFNNYYHNAEREYAQAVEMEAIALERMEEAIVIFQEQYARYEMQLMLEEGV